MSTFDFACAPGAGPATTAEACSMGLPSTVARRAFAPLTHLHERRQVRLILRRVEAGLLVAFEGTELRGKAASMEAGWTMPRPNVAGRGSDGVAPVSE